MIKALILISILSGPVSPKDSIGIETINGKVFVIHKVDEKETLYAISRRYRTTVDAIVEYNAGADRGLEIGQILKVPYTPVAKTTLSAGAETHTVAAKETLYSISRAYGVSVDDLRKWNSLTSDALSVGQELVIKQAATQKTTLVNNQRSTDTPGETHTVAAQETLYSISRQYGVSVDQLKAWNNLDDAALKIGQVLRVKAKATSTPVTQTVTERPKEEPAVVRSEPERQPETKRELETVQETVVQPHTIRISESMNNGSESVESGIAELIEGTEGNRKYLALHRTAPIGTILKVRNEMNSREVFVRVMGKLPDTALTNKVIIRISKSAHDRLGAIDQRFRVEVTYYK